MKSGESHYNKANQRGHRLAFSVDSDRLENQLLLNRLITVPLYRLSTQRLNFDVKPKEVLIEAVNKFLKEKLKQKEFVFSDSQLKFTKKLKDGLIGEIGL